jgi:hypothetical protein
LWTSAGSLTALAYTPRRGRLQGASVSAVAMYLGSLVLVAFAFSNPIVLGGCSHRCERESLCVFAAMADDEPCNARHARPFNGEATT